MQMRSVKISEKNYFCMLSCYAILKHTLRHKFTFENLTNDVLNVIWNSNLFCLAVYNIEMSVYVTLYG